MKKLIHSTSLRINLLSNFSGNALMAVLNILFIPLYLKYVGTEGYGLIGIFASIQSILYLLDSGLSITLNKELASLSALQRTQQMLNLVKSLEYVYWPIAMLVGLIATAMSPFLALHWVHARDLDIHTIRNSFFILSATLVFQFTSGFYAGGLLGLQRHLLYNLVRVFFAVLKNVGALLVLIWYSHSIIDFFLWNLAITAIQTVFSRYLLWILIKKPNQKAVFDKKELKRVAKFAGGMGTIAMSAIMIQQADKIVLSKSLLLEQFGYYTLSVTAGMLLLQVITPISQSFFPKFAYLSSKNNETDALNALKSSTQMIGVIVYPVSMILIFYTRQVLQLWTNNPLTADHTWFTARLFLIGTCLNAVISILFTFCFARNWTKFALYISLVQGLIAGPAIALFSYLFGPNGAASSWIVLNVCYMLVIPAIVYRRFFPGNVLEWYWRDVLQPLLGCFGFLIVSRTLFPLENCQKTVLITALLVQGIIATAITVLISGRIRIAVLQALLVRR